MKRVTALLLFVMSTGSCSFVMGQSASAPAHPVVPSDKSSAGVPTQGGVQILSDTEGVNFSPYVKQWYAITQTTWLQHMPSAVNQPQLLKGVVAIRFKILPSGHIKDGSMILEGRSGYEVLDRAAWAALTGSNYPALPSEFHGPYVELRVVFVYNMKTR
jgi:hypothetical protein